jgi:hypothetical protein
MLLKRSHNYLQLIFTILFFTGKSQTVFQRTFGDTLAESSYTVHQTSDKGYILSGFTKSYSTGNDFYLIKTDSLANVTWSKIYSGDVSDQAFAMQPTTDGGYILAGYTTSFGVLYNDACLLKIDANGDTLWEKNYGASGFEFANTVTQTSDGGYIFAGYSEGNTIFNSQGSIYLVKVNSTGTVQWKKILGPSGQITDGYSIKQTTDKGYILTGYTNGYGEINGDAYLMKLDSTGNPVFVKTYGNKGSDWGYSVQQTTDGGFIIGGSYSLDSTSRDIDAYIIKTDANGDTLWTRTYGGTGFDYGQSITQTSDGGYALGGYTNSFSTGDYDVFLLKVNANGDTLFTRTFGGYNDDEANFITQTSDGGFALAGQSNSFGMGDYDFYFVKTDANGNSSCFQTNVHAPKKTPATIVTTASMMQDTVGLIMINGHPDILTGSRPTDVCLSVGVKESKMVNDELNIFPNPTAGIFNLSAENFSGNAKVTITNVLGENVYTNKEQKFPDDIDLSSQPAGTYFLQAVTDGKIHNFKILVNK